MDVPLIFSNEDGDGGMKQNGLFKKWIDSIILHVILGKAKVI
jgi:hypothetical protein